MLNLGAVCLLLVGVSFAPPPLSPRVGNLLNDLNLNDYNDLMLEQEIDLPVLAQLSDNNYQGWEFEPWDKESKS